MLFFGVILYVDNTDLLLRADNPEIPDSEFFQKTQRALSACAQIALATGGYVKATECQASIGIPFSFVNSYPAIDVDIHQHYRRVQ